MGGVGGGGGLPLRWCGCRLEWRGMLLSRIGRGGVRRLTFRLGLGGLGRREIESWRSGSGDARRGGGVDGGSLYLLMSGETGLLRSCWLWPQENWIGGVMDCRVGLAGKLRRWPWREVG
jgi:hypothetical protein